MNNNKDIIAWLGWVFVSPIAALTMILLLLSACIPLDLCPDMQCEYGYAEATGAETAPSPGDAPGHDKGDDGKGDRGKGEKGDRDNDKGRASEKGESDDGRERAGKDKGDEGDDD